MIKNTNRRRALLATALLALAPAGVFAATDFTTVIPAESLAAVWSNDLGALRKGAEASPYGKLWNDPACEPLRQFVADKIAEFKKEMGEEGLTPEELEAVFSQSAAIYVRLLDGAKEPNFVVISELDEAGRALMDKKVGEIGKNFVKPLKDSYEVDGISVFRVKGIPASADADSTLAPEETTAQYAFVDKHLVISDDAGETLMREAVATLKAAPETRKGLASRPENALVGASAKRADAVQFFMNTRASIEASIKMAEDSTPEDATKTLAAFETWGLLDLETLNVTVGFGADSTDYDATITTPKVKRGITKALYTAGPQQMNILSLAPKDSLSVTAFSLDVGAIIDESLAALRTTNPEIAPMADMYKGMAAQQMGVDIIDEILKNLSGEHLVVTRALTAETKAAMTPEEALLQNGTVAIFGLRNERVAAGLKTLFDKLTEDPALGGTLERAEVDGMATVAQMGDPETPGALRPALAFDSKFLIVTNDHTQLPDMIRATKGKLAAPLAEEASFKAVNATIAREQLHYVSYTPAAAIAAALEQVAKFAAMSPETQEAGFDPTMLPSPDVVKKYLGDSYAAGYLKEDGMVFTGKSLAAK